MILLNRLSVVDWNLSKIIIFDRNCKFLSKLWIIILNRFDVKLMYFIIYHSRIDEQFERIDQIIEIMFYYYIIVLSKFFDWFKMLEQVQRCLNNVVFITIKKISNEIIYEFTSLQIINLLKFFAVDQTTDS